MPLLHFFLRACDLAHGYVMKTERWFAIYVVLSGVFFLARAFMLSAALTPILPGSWPSPEVVAQAEEVQRFLSVMVAVNVSFGVAAVVAGAGLFLLKPWAHRLWLVVCAFLLIVAALATMGTEVPWHEYVPELILVVVSFTVLWKRPSRSLDVS